ncbi:MAG: acyltransferase [Helicobacteraceae bacterium]
MTNSKIINELMFDYADMSDEKIRKTARALPDKLLRWLGANHPDNKTRKIFFAMTGVFIGEGSVINQNFIVSDDYEPLLKIGARVAIAPGVTVICSSSPNNSELCNIIALHTKGTIAAKKVVIEDDVWIGANAVILPGVTIGKSSIVGAGSVVTKDLAPFGIYAGTPAKELRRLAPLNP